MTSDRKAMIRDYKEAPRQMGVIRIVNGANGRQLIEACRDTRARINRHRFLLQNGLHRNDRLIADWKQFGAEAFEFGVLDVLEPPEEVPRYDPSDDLLELEALWREKLGGELY